MDHKKYIHSQAKRFSGENHQAQGRLKQAFKFFKPIVKSDKPLLDIGSRDGWFIEFLERKRYKDVQGIEITKNAVAHAQSKGRNVTWGDAHDLSRFIDEQFTTVLMIHSLEHCHNPDIVIDSVYRILQPGGVFFIEVPLEDDPDEDVAHFCSFASVHDVVKKLGDRFELLKHKVSPFCEAKHLLCGFRKK